MGYSYGEKTEYKIKKRVSLLICEIPYGQGFAERAVNYFIGVVDWRSRCRRHG